MGASAPLSSMLLILILLRALEDIMMASFLQFMLIFKKARDGTLEIEGLKAIANTCDVATEGVGGAKAFFEAKAQKVGKVTSLKPRLSFVGAL